MYLAYEKHTKMEIYHQTPQITHSLQPTSFFSLRFPRKKIKLNRLELFMLPDSMNPQVWPRIRQSSRHLHSTTIEQRRPTRLATFNADFYALLGDLRDFGAVYFPKRTWPIITWYVQLKFVCAICVEEALVMRSSHEYDTKYGSKNIYSYKNLNVYHNHINVIQCLRLSECYSTSSSFFFFKLVCYFDTFKEFK